MEDVARRVFYNLREVVISRIGGAVGVKQGRVGPAAGAVLGRAEDVIVRVGAVDVLFGLPYGVKGAIRVLDNPRVPVITRIGVAVDVEQGRF